MDGAAARSTERAARGAATRPAAAWNIMDCAANSICEGIGEGSDSARFTEVARVPMQVLGTGEGKQRMQALQAHTTQRSLALSWLRLFDQIVCGTFRLDVCFAATPTVRHTGHTQQGPAKAHVTRARH